MGAKVGAALGEEDAFDGGLADGAGLASAAENLELVLVGAALAGKAGVVGLAFTERGAFGVYTA